LELLEKRLVTLDDLISDEFTLSEGVRAMTRAAEKGVMKVLLSMTK